MTNKQKKSSSNNNCISIKPKTKNQGHLLTSIYQNILTICTGPAGCGKTYISIGCGCKLLMENSIARLVISRPIVVCGSPIGIMPGDLEDKIVPYFIPVVDTIKLFIGGSNFDKLFRNGRILFAPTELMRGITFDNAYIVLDEAQNMTYLQIKTAITRLGNKSKMIINGDPEQSDISGSCLMSIIDKLSGLESVGVLKFNNKDVCRSDFVQKVLKRL